MKERLNQRAAAALVVLGLLAGSLSGCGQAQIGEKQAFSPNVTEQEQTQQEEQQHLEQLKISGDYDLLTASPWNCAQLNSRRQLHCCMMHRSAFRPIFPPSRRWQRFPAVGPSGH